ncbi:hypothetical protein V6N11_013742 [Hibiscus sabdariffa]|uniref:Cytochrome P450 n=1 Tax=Hibiscus sabdariffa TaxID=183260 RepID=A0ABR2PCU9_9ROSI
MTKTVSVSWISLTITSATAAAGVVPLLLPRKAEEDIQDHNLVVPKGAQVLINAWSIGRDPNCWEEPELFRPERFIGSDMDVKGRNFGLIPFGSGP